MTKKKALSLLLTLALTAGLCVTPAFAAEKTVQIPISGGSSSLDGVSITLSNVKAAKTVPVTFSYPGDWISDSEFKMEFEERDITVYCLSRSGSVLTVTDNEEREDLVFKAPGCVLGDDGYEGDRRIEAEDELQPRSAGTHVSVFDLNMGPAYVETDIHGIGVGSTNIYYTYCDLSQYPDAGMTEAVPVSQADYDFQPFTHENLTFEAAATGYQITVYEVFNIFPYVDPDTGEMVFDHIYSPNPSAAMTYPVVILKDGSHVEVGEETNPYAAYALHRQNGCAQDGTVVIDHYTEEGDWLPMEEITSGSIDNMLPHMEDGSPTMVEANRESPDKFFFVRAGDAEAFGITSSAQPEPEAEGQVTSDGIRVLFRDQGWNTDVGAWHEIDFTNTTDQPIQGCYGMLTYRSSGSQYQYHFFDLDLAPGETITLKKNSGDYLNSATQMIWIRFDDAQDRDDFIEAADVEDYYGYYWAYTDEAEAFVHDTFGI